MTAGYESKMIVEGSAAGSALVSDMPLSFWGGVSILDGHVIDVHHPLCGQALTGRVLCIPYDRGSCSGSGIMLEMINRRIAPAAIICLEAEPVLSLGSVLGYKLYGRGVPIHTVTRAVFDSLKNGATVTVNEGGGIVVEID